MAMEEFVEIDIDNEVLSEIMQGLGHILKKTEKRAVLKKAKAHRKEMGIYYTPTYIVDYIVRNTLGELLKDKKIKVEKIRILDPACGPGSFLIKAYDLLNEYYAHKKKADMGATSLTGHIEDSAYTVKEKILQDNIFGVDLDKQAVEIAQLNLLLKIAEKGHRLPLLQENIKCGNSLIDDPEIAGDKAFKWEKEFKQIMDEGGFDIIIGNPPWVQSKSLPEKDKEYYVKKYGVARKQYDLFTLFIENSLNLLKEGGTLGFIVPDRFITNLDYEPFRKYLLGNCCIKQIIVVGEDVFEGVEMPSAIIILERCSSESRRNSNSVATALGLDSRIQKVEQKEFLKNDGYIFDIFGDRETKSIMQKIERKSVKLRELVYNARGVEIGKKSNVVSASKGDVKFLIGSDIDRYQIKGVHYLKLGDKNVDYKDESLYKGEKILIRKTGLGINAVLDKDSYVIQVIYILKQKNKDYDLRYLLGILNSRLMNYYYFSKFGQKERKTFPHLTQGKVLQLPIKISAQEPLIKFVDKMLSLNKRLNEIGDKKTDERARIEEGIKKTDTEIDELVYKIYGITEAEKKIIEESLK